jgi:hypothetical protein
MEKQELMFPTEIRGIKATRVGEFTRQGEKRYRFVITGTPAALAAWKKARGQYYLEDEVTKQVIFIAIPSVAVQLLKSGGKMLISPNGRVAPDYDSLVELVEDEQMYREAFAKAKAEADVRQGLGAGRAFGQRSSAPRNFNVPSNETIATNLADAANADLNEADLAEQEQMAAAAQQAEPAPVV